jgi:hypothetical protein
MFPLRSVAAVLALSIAGCSAPAGPSAPDLMARAVASVDARLAGAWRLQGFRPERPLDPMSQAFLQVQFGQLVVRFDRGRMVGESPGVHVDRAYRISEADLMRFKITAYDEQGVPYDAVCTFAQPDVLEVNSWSEPWRGVATLTRDPGGR